MTDLPREFVDQIARAIGDPGSVVGRKFGPSWGEGNDGYAENEETVTRWSTRAVLEVLVASGWRPEAEVLRDAGKSIERHIDSYQVVSRQLIQQLKTRTADPELIRQRQRLERRYMRGMWAAADDVYELAEAADEQTAERATALEPVGALPVADGSFGAVVHEQSDLKGTSKAGQERSEEKEHA